MCSTSKEGINEISPAHTQTDCMTLSLPTRNREIRLFKKLTHIELAKFHGQTLDFLLSSPIKADFSSRGLRPCDDVYKLLSSLTEEGEGGSEPKNVCAITLCVFAPKNRLH